MIRPQFARFSFTKVFVLLGACSFFYMLVNINLHPHEQVTTTGPLIPPYVWSNDPNIQKNLINTNKTTTVPLVPPYLLEFNSETQDKPGNQRRNIQHGNRQGPEPELPSDCGVMTVDSNFNNQREINAKNYPFGNTTFHVEIWRKKSSDNDPPFRFCGGAHVDDFWVITAASCLYDEEDKQILAELLSVEFSVVDQVKDATTYVIPVQKYIISKDYNRDNNAHNIAFIKLAKSVKEHPEYERLKSSLAPLCIPKQDLDDDNARNGLFCVMTSYGNVSPDATNLKTSKFPAVLQYNEVIVMIPSICELGITPTVFQNELKKPRCFVTSLTNENNRTGLQVKMRPSYGDVGSPVRCLVKNRWYLDGIYNHIKNVQQLYDNIICNAYIATSMFEALEEFEKVRSNAQNHM